MATQCRPLCQHCWAVLWRYVRNKQPEWHNRYTTHGACYFDDVSCLSVVVINVTRQQLGVNIALLFISNNFLSRFIFIRLMEWGQHHLVVSDVMMTVDVSYFIKTEEIFPDRFKFVFRNNCHQLWCIWLCLISAGFSNGPFDISPWDVDTPAYTNYLISNIANFINVLTYAFLHLTANSRTTWFIFAAAFVIVQSQMQRIVNAQTMYALCNNSQNEFD